MGDLGIVKSNGLMARFIQVGTMSRWNHAFVYVGNEMIIEAKPRGVVLSPLSDYDGVKIVWNKHQEWNDEEVDREFIAEEAHKLLDLPYNWTNIARIILRSLGLKTLSNTKFMKKLAKKDGYICSEMVEELYSKSGNPLVSKEPGVTSPGDLIEAVIYQ
jgi:uncharacterized protein YycO